jgi:hypothetical protein
MLIPFGVLSAAAEFGPPPVPAPAVVETAQLWLDAEDSSTITHSGGAVSQWNNKGTLGNFTQATGALQPTTNATTLNGRNIIDFNQDSLVAVTQNEWKFLHDGTKYFVCAVAKTTDTDNPGIFVALYGSFNGASGEIGAFMGYSDASPDSDEFAYTIGAGVSGSLVVANRPQNAVTPNAFSLLGALADPSNATVNDRAKLFVNNAAITPNVVLANIAPSSSNPTTALRIGALGTDLSGIRGSIAEMVIVSGANATDGNRIIVRDYLNEKWGIY